MKQPEVEQLVKDQDALDKLSDEAASEEDRAYLAEEQGKLNSARHELGKDTIHLVETPNGVATRAEVETWRRQGQNPNEGAYKGNRR